MSWMILDLHYEFLTCSSTFLQVNAKDLRIQELEDQIVLMRKAANGKHLGENGLHVSESVAWGINIPNFILSFVDCHRTLHNLILKNCIIAQFIGLRWTNGTQTKSFYKVCCEIPFIELYKSNLKLLNCTHCLFSHKIHNRFVYFCTLL